MFGLRFLRDAVTGLAAAITDLRDTVRQANTHLRDQLALDGPPPAADVIDHQPAAAQPAALPGGADRPPAGGNGRAARARAAR